MWTWLKNIFSKKTANKEILAWEEVTSGDYVAVYLKDPETVGIAKEHRSMTFQRLDEEDIRTKKVIGYVIRTIKAEGNIEGLEISVVKQHRGKTRLVDYLLLKEEIQEIRLLGENKK